MPPPQNDKNEQDFQFTMYDLRGPWADQKVKEALLPQLNAKLAAAVLLDRVQTREKADRLARSEEREKIYSTFVNILAYRSENLLLKLQMMTDYLKSLLPPNKE